MNDFEKYRSAYDTMEANPAILRARKAVTDYQTSLAGLEEPYRGLMYDVAKGIQAIVLAEEKSVSLFGVVAKYRKGKHTPRWKEIAMLSKPSDSLVAKHTSIGKPSVSIAIKEDKK